MLYLPVAYRARMVSMFLVAIPMSAVIGAPRVMGRRSHTAVTFLIAAIGLILTALSPNPYLRLCALSFASFGIFSVWPVFWSMPTAFLCGAAAAAGVDYINSIANIAGFVGNYVMGVVAGFDGEF